MSEDRKMGRLGRVLLVSTALAVCAAAVCRRMRRKGSERL